MKGCHAFHGTNVSVMMYFWFPRQYGVFCEILGSSIEGSRERKKAMIAACDAERERRESESAGG